MTVKLDKTLAQPVVALIAGIVILLKPELLSIIVAVYLIIIGILGIVKL